MEDSWRDTVPEVSPRERIDYVLYDDGFVVVPGSTRVLPSASSDHRAVLTELALLPEGALLVNVARGKLVDTGALTAEVATGRIRAALDVVDPEPLPPDHPLWRLPGALISPHVGGASSAFAPRADRLIAAQLARFAAGEPLANVVRPARR